MLGVTQIGEGANLVGHHAVGAGGAVLVKHQIHAVAIGAAEGEGVVVILALEKDLFLAVGKERDVYAEGVFGGEDVR